jgi:hypothetical protein
LSWEADRLEVLGDRWRARSKQLRALLKAITILLEDERKQFVDLEQQLARLQLLRQCEARGKPTPAKVLKVAMDVAREGRIHAATRRACRMLLESEILQGSGESFKAGGGSAPKVLHWAEPGVIEQVRVFIPIAEETNSNDGVSKTKARRRRGKRGQRGQGHF